MDSITTTNTISLNCDIELTNKVISLHGVHLARSQQNCNNKYELLTKSCQERISAIANIAIELISYFINLCASFGWQSAHSIYCIKFIRLNQRALINTAKSIRLVEHVKTFGIYVTKNIQFKLYPIIQMIRRKSYFNENECNNDICHTFEHRINTSTTMATATATATDTTETTATIDDSNDINDINNNNNNDRNSDDHHTTRLGNDVRDGIDSISMEILWEPQCNGTQITADIVFIHGLHGSSDSTWKQGEWMHKPADDRIQIKHHENAATVNFKHDTHLHTEADNKFSGNNCYSNSGNSTLESLSQCWPKDWLPIDFPTARVCAINYDTDPHLWRPIWYPSKQRSNLSIRAMKMIRILVEHKIGVNRPIIWVGHSKGGLYIKQIIVSAHECCAYWLWKSSRAVLFYSVPHRGSPLAELNLPLLTRSIEIIEIQSNFCSIMDLHRRFVTMCRKGILSMDVFSFIETKFTELSIFYLRIIGVDSGDPGIGGICVVPLDHLDVCKPRNRNCFLYLQLSNMVKGALNAHARTIHDVFDTQKK